MDKQLIATVVNKITEANPSLANETRIARFYFEGNTKLLSKLRVALKAQGVQVEKSSVDLVVLDTVIVNTTSIESKLAEYESIALAHGVTLDGFEVAVNDLLQERPRLPEFDKYHKPGSMLAYKLSKGGFGYFIYLGGNIKSGGYVFDFIDFHSANLEYDVNKIACYPRLYRQPLVMVYIDPRAVIPIGRIAVDYSNVNSSGIYYKCLMGMEAYQTLIDNGVYAEGEDFPLDREIDVLLDYVAAGRVFHLKNWYSIFSYTFTKNGRCRVKEEYTGQRDQRFDRAYQYGVILTMEFVESRLLKENRDLVYLTDAVFK